MSNRAVTTKAIGDAIEAMLSSTGWMLVLALGVPSLSGILIMITGMGSAFLPDVSSMEDLAFHPTANFLVSIWSSLIICLLLKLSLGVRTAQSAIQRLALHPISVVPLAAVITLSLLFSGVESYLYQVALVEEPDAMLSIEAQTNTAVKMLLLFITVGILGPFIEELIYRGVAFERLRHTPLGLSGAIIIPSIVFTLTHTQYEQVAVIILIFISSCMFGLIRHITGNLWYCVVAHMVMNISVIAQGFL